MSIDEYLFCLKVRESTLDGLRQILTENNIQKAGFSLHNQDLLHYTQHPLLATLYFKNSFKILSTLENEDSINNRI